MSRRFLSLTASVAARSKAKRFRTGAASTQSPFYMPSKSSPLFAVTQTDAFKVGAIARRGAPRAAQGRARARFRARFPRRWRCTD